MLSVFQTITSTNDVLKTNSKLHDKLRETIIYTFWEAIQTILELHFLGIAIKIYDDMLHVMGWTESSARTNRAGVILDIFLMDTRMKITTTE